MGFDTAPRPYFMRSVAAERWTVAGALAELVDNSFGPARGNADLCEITYDTKRHVITVLDNGRGMVDGVGRLFQLGNAISTSGADIGMYGAGGSKALIWLARRVEVWTMLDTKKLNHDAVDWDKQLQADAYPVVSDAWEKANASNTPERLLAKRHGTLVVLHLRGERKFQVSNVQRALAEIYAPAIRKHKRLVWQTVGKNGITQDLADRMLEFDPEQSAYFDGYLQVPTGGEPELLGIRGVVGIVPDLPLQKSQVSFGYGARVIFSTRDCYRSSDQELYNTAGVAGYVDLLEGWQPYLTVTKDEIDSDPVRAVLMSWIFDKARPFLKKVKHDSEQILLNDIALSLADALSGRGHEGSEGADSTEPVYGEGPGPIPGSGHAHIDIKPKDESPVAKGRLPSGAVFQIHRKSDAEIGGVLCTAETVGDAVVLSVNADHSYVRMALEHRPQNRMALEMLVTRELADLLEHDVTLFDKAFRSRDEKGRIDGSVNRGQVIHRLLIDRIPSAA